MATLLWYRNDLRIGDNPAVAAAAARGLPVAGLYVLESDACGVRPQGAASLWKLHGALAALAESLGKLGAPLILMRGPAETAIRAALTATGADAVYWNRRYEPAAVEVDKAVMSGLKADGIEVLSFGGSLLAEPWQVATASGGPFKVFSPFCKAARAANIDLRPLPAPEEFAQWNAKPNLGDNLDDWGLLPTRPDWAGGLRATWGHGEQAARKRLAAFIDDGFAGYRDGRDFPATSHCSALSPHLRFGEIGPRQVRHAAYVAAARAQGALDADFETLERELYWRDFSYNQLFHGADLAGVNVQEKFDRFPWRDDDADLKVWTRGMTGYPIVDAGMRQLWESGWMHNRVRMAAASFLTKHLMIDWREGERWFWDTLVDADPASNPANWQWVAGSGADAAPYFRIFNPTAQGEKFDADGAYVRRWVPELKALPKKFLHAPWTAPDGVLATAGVKLGESYPAPIVDHKAARERALAAFKTL